MVSQVLNEHTQWTDTIRRDHRWPNYMRTQITQWSNLCLVKIGQGLMQDFLPGRGDDRVRQWAGLRKINSDSPDSACRNCNS